MYRTVVTICTAQRSLYVPHSGHYMYRTAATICTAQRSLYVPHSGHYMYSPVVTICTASLTFTIPRSAHTVYLCVLCGSENKQRWRSCLRHCATSRNVACSIPDSVIAVFHWHNPSDRTMAMGTAQPLTEMITRNISWGGGKGGRWIRLTTLPLSCAYCLKTVTLKLLDVSNPLQGSLYLLILRTSAHCIMDRASLEYMSQERFWIQPM